MSKLLDRKVKKFNEDKATKNALDDDFLKSIENENVNQRATCTVFLDSIKPFLIKAIEKKIGPKRLCELIKKHYGIKMSSSTLHLYLVDRELVKKRVRYSSTKSDLEMNQISNESSAVISNKSVTDLIQNSQKETFVSNNEKDHSSDLKTDALLNKGRVVNTTSTFNID
ncbi:MAG: hypothetical protein MR830_10680 [Succinatimonas sp.]|jgi:hypothetical protein|nr:hypothetical protein [Succinatimonas sp.]MCI6907430.1 hypothetical protein [Succinatimonas sp.]